MWRQEMLLKVYCILEDMVSFIIIHFQKSVYYIIIKSMCFRCCMLKIDYYWGLDLLMTEALEVC